MSNRVRFPLSSHRRWRFSWVLSCCYSLLLRRRHWEHFCGVVCLPSLRTSQRLDSLSLWSLPHPIPRSSHRSSHRSLPPKGFGSVLTSRIHFSTAAATAFSASQWILPQWKRNAWISLVFPSPRLHWYLHYQVFWKLSRICTLSLIPPRSRPHLGGRWEWIGKVSNHYCITHPHCFPPSFLTRLSRVETSHVFLHKPFTKLRRYLMQLHW